MLPPTREQEVTGERPKPEVTGERHKPTTTPETPASLESDNSVAQPTTEVEEQRQSVPAETVVEPAELRSGRKTKAPVWSKDYVM